MFGRKWPTFAFSAKRRPTITKIFQLNSNKSGTNKDTGFKFSAFVYHMSGLNWQKNFGHCSINKSVAPSSMQKLWALLATIYVEKKIWKKFWWGFRHIWVTPWKEFLISWKKWRFEIFRTALPSRASVVHGLAYSSTYFQRSNWYLAIMIEKDLGSTFNHFMLIQNTTFFKISKIPSMG